MRSKTKRKVNCSPEEIKEKLLGLEESDFGRKNKGEETESERKEYNKHWECRAQIQEMTNENPSGYLMHMSSPITLDVELRN